jgi:Zn-dependent M28 family amino/carboxypeptidase
VAALPAPRHRLSEPARTHAAEEQIAAWLAEPGWSVERQALTGGSNVVAVREGDDPTALLVVAHHDTVAGSGGADDNASGVVALAEVARLLAGVRLRRSVVLAAVDLEETGSFAGTEALVARLRRERPIAGGVVLESVAFSDPRPGTQQVPPGLGLLYPAQLRQARALGMAATWTLLLYRRSALPLVRAVGSAIAATAGPEAVLAVRDPLELPLGGGLLPLAVPTVRHFARSDHVALWRHGIPAILLTDTANLRNVRYHTAFDVPETLDYPRLADVAVATAFGIARLAGADWQAARR